MREFWKWSSDLDGRSVFFHLEPFPGAVEALVELGEDGHQIVVVTTKPEFAIDDTHEWIQNHGIPAVEIHILEDKWRVPCDVYLDDSPYVVPDYVAQRPDRVTCRFVRPWNEPVRGARDVASWAEFHGTVRALSDGRGQDQDAV